MILAVVVACVVDVCVVVVCCLSVLLVLVVVVFVDVCGCLLLSVLSLFDVRCSLCVICGC